MLMSVPHDGRKSRSHSNRVPRLGILNLKCIVYDGKFDHPSQLRPLEQGLAISMVALTIEDPNNNNESCVPMGSLTREVSQSGSVMSRVTRPEEPKARPQIESDRVISAQPIFDQLC
jgi:hypothetical protein